MAGLAAAACGGVDAPPPSGNEPRLLRLADLEVAVRRNLQRGALVNLWATW